jgi:hypothetical protein
VTREELNARSTKVDREKCGTGLIERKLLLTGFLFRYLGAFFSRFGQSDGNRLLSAFYDAALATFP